jgi:hypothetical protein
MGQSTLKAFAREQGWYKSEGVLFGLYRNYVFVVPDEQGQTRIVAPMSAVSQEAVGQVKGELAARKKVLAFSDLTVGDDGVVLLFKETFRATKKEGLQSAMDFLVDLFERARLPHTNVCEECKSATGLGYYSVAGVPVLWCSGCHERKRMEIERGATEYTDEEKGYMRGALGASLFSLGGIILWVVLAYYTNRIYAVLAFVFGWLALKGYDLFQARRGRWTPAIVITISIVSVVVSNVATMLFELVMEGLTLAQSWELFWVEPEIQGVVWKNLLVSLLVCAIAIFYLGKKMWKEHRPASVNAAMPAE